MKSSYAIVYYATACVDRRDQREIRRLVTMKNKLLLEHGSPTLGPAKELIGDPNLYLSEEVCVMLVMEGVLRRTPVRDTNGRQIQLKLEPEHLKLLWDYQWGAVEFAALSEEKLEQVAWDLRNHGNFAHVTYMEEYVQPETVTEPETVLDSEDSDEYDEDKITDYECSIAETLTAQEHAEESGE